MSAANNRLVQAQERKKFSAQDEEDDLIILQQNEKDIRNYLSFTERYFTKYYKLNVRFSCNDHMLLIHSNKVVISCLAPSHPLLDKEMYEPIKVEFLQSVNEDMSGKHKHAAKNLNSNQPLCRISCARRRRQPSDQQDQADQEIKSFTIYSCMNAKLIETNERLVEKPALIQEKPFTEAYLAILYPKLDNFKDQISEFIDHHQYLAEIEKRSNQQVNSA